MKTWRVTSLILALLLLTGAPRPTAAGPIGPDLSQLNRELMALESYIRYDQDGRLQTLEAQAARKAGFAQDTLLLAEEIVAFQNNWVKAAGEAKSLEQSGVTVEQYPRLARLFDLASQRARTGGFSIQSAIPCGDWDHPVPNYSPSWNWWNSSNPAQTMQNLGFHRTAGYACGDDPIGTCDSDWTRGRSYTGPYGTCSSPRFRDHGQTTSTRYGIQYGEPNPEVLSYSWPYWNWPAYVQWWHANY